MLSSLVRVDPPDSTKLSRYLVGIAFIVVEVLPAGLLSLFAVVVVTTGWWRFGLRHISGLVSLFRFFSLFAIRRGFFDNVSHVGGFWCWESCDDSLEGHWPRLFLQLFRGNCRRCEDYMVSINVLNCSMGVLDRHRFRVYIHVLNAERAFNDRRGLMPVLLSFFC